MATATLTQTSTLQCPHGGKVQIIPAQTRVTAGGAPVATDADTFTVVGCPFHLPGTPPVPSPCVEVRWLMADTRVSAGAATLSHTSQGLCRAATGAPQGKVVIGAGQGKVSSS